jgi:hypothetical protein
MHADASTVTPAAGPGPPSAHGARAGAVRLGQRDVTGLLLCGDMYGVPYDMPAPRGAETRILAEHEQWFGVLTRRLLRRGEFTSRDDLESKITAFTIGHNKTARPYRWSYDADTEHARYLQRHHQPESVTVLPEAA